MCIAGYSWLDEGGTVVGLSNLPLLKKKKMKVKKTPCRWAGYRKILTLTLTIQPQLEYDKHWFLFGLQSNPYLVGIYDIDFFFFLIGDC